ncbi:transketolase [Granulicella cerasi]|uniref:Transketolase n=1 Tax=Granulicella cerasi TaxID=741063 RepID=A0ABW1ZDH8_9BACT|nr:transketolase [Granulicella cerasi]
MSELSQQELDQLSINTLRLLAVDQVEKANSGHPGAPLGCAPIAYLLFHKFMKYNPKESLWSDRDRFVLSNGHASALLYGTLHLAGFKVSMDDLKSFRQWESRTPGHPESHETDGVEVTTGPLGQGFAEAVGLAIAEKHQAAVYNNDKFKIVDHYTYVICGDGCLMEGISHEAASLAGTLKLNKLIVLYDDNLISLDGPTDLSYTEDVTKRFEAYGWHVEFVSDGNDLDEISKAIEAGKSQKEKPTLIRVRTVIGFGAPKAGTKSVHGEPLGKEGTIAAKKFFGFDPEKSFFIPEEALTNWRKAEEKGAKAVAAWHERFDAYAKEFPELAAQYTRTSEEKLPADWQKELPVFPSDKPVATRNAGQVVLNKLGAVLPELFGGAADLTSSTKTIFKDSANFHEDPKGRNVFFGVREFGMMAAVNGISAHGGLLPFGSTFFTFSDYCRSALRMGALQHSRSLYIFTHDSVGLGEDGPTHQPVEHLGALRIIPELTDFRPADANETSAAWGLAVERGGPAWMALSRQDLPTLDADKYKVFDGVRKGAYKLESYGSDVVLVSTGSEVQLILKAGEELKAAGINATVVSMPSFKIFEEQTAEYKDSIFPKNVPVVSIEAAATQPWYKYVGRDGYAIGIDRFGASAPGPLVLEKLGITAAHVVEAAKKVVKK